MKNKQTRKPDWIRIQLPANNKMNKIKRMLRTYHHVTVCEEAACPNQSECFSCGTATFMIMGDLCTRRCKFCNVKHGKPNSLDPKEPENLAKTIVDMGLKYTVITSVDRDDLSDGGASHFAACIRAIRQINSNIKIEILTPDFRGCLKRALDAFKDNLPDVFNHNIETAPSLFTKICPSADYALSLTLLKTHKEHFPNIPTKSGMMLGLGETNEEIESVMTDLRAHKVDRLTFGQYLQPSKHHLPVDQYVTPEKFNEFAVLAKKMGFSHVASGPLVRSSYHAEKQTSEDEDF